MIGFYLSVWLVFFLAIQTGIWWRGYPDQDFSAKDHAKFCLVWPLLLILLVFDR